MWPGPDVMRRQEEARARFDREATPHIAELLRFATRLTGNRDRAEELVQDVFLQAWRIFDRYQEGTNCRAWLYRILLHTMQRERRRWFRLALFRPIDEVVENTVAYSDPVPAVLKDEEILRALDQVPENFRAVLLLVDVEEWTYKEAAEALDVPIGTVMSRLSRGRKILRELLAESGVAQ